eukprot:gene17618-9257_t
MRDVSISTLFKKGDRGLCDNYCGISLLLIVGKLYARVALGRLQKHAERVYSDSQCGFREGRSTVEMIFSLRQLQEKCREQRMPHLIAFDITKEFDIVSRSGLFKLREKIGCPPTLLSIIKSFNETMKGTVTIDGNTSEPFSIESGVKQGDVSAPNLLGILFALMLMYALVTLQKVSTSEPVMANSTAQPAYVPRPRDLLFADDAAIVAHSEAGLQKLMDRLFHACKAFGPTISIKKTKILAQGVTDPNTSIKIDGNELENANKFNYLRLTISSGLFFTDEINARTGKAAAAYSKLEERVWKKRNLIINTKMQIYKTCALSTLLYGSESWTIYSKEEPKLNSFHLRHLRRILGIHWEDRIHSTEVLKRANSTSIQSMLSHRRLRWLGHVKRMEIDRIPKQLLYGKLVPPDGHSYASRMCANVISKPQALTIGSCLLPIGRHGGNKTVLVPSMLKTQG